MSAKVIMYTKTFCPYCVRAKDLLNSKGIKVVEINLENKPDELAALKQRTGLMTVPQIFINEKLIGGFSDMAALDAEGKLDPLLKQA
jgi:glutaredoxin 3